MNSLISIVTGTISFINEQKSGSKYCIVHIIETNIKKHIIKEGIAAKLGVVLLSSFLFRAYFSLLLEGLLKALIGLARAQPQLLLLP